MADEPEQIILGDTAISAVERSARRRWFGRGKDRQALPFTHCQNCGAELTGPHCGQCGQAAIDYRRSFRHVIVDVLDSFLNWDSKFFATIGLLVIKPWRLTNEFLAGKRVRYLHPLRLYLLASILFFFAINYGAKGLRLELGTISEKKSSTPFERWLEARAKEKMGEHGTKMGLFITTLFSNLPYMMLCCIPLFAFVLKILYIRRHIFYIDHLIYALHIHTFFYTGIMLIVLATMGLHRIAPPTLAGWIIAFLWILFVVQIFLSSRRVYRQGWFMSTLKFLVGGFAYLIVLFLALAATFFITLALPTS